MSNTMGLYDELGQKEEGDGEHRAGDGEVGSKKMVEEGHCDGKANTESSYHEEKSREDAFSSSLTLPLPETHVHHRQIRHESMAAYVPSGEHAHENMAAYVPSGEHAHESVAAYGTSGEHAPENVAAYGTSGEHAQENVAAYGTSDEHAQENMAAYGTLGQHEDENVAVYGTLGQHARENMSANGDNMVTNGQLGEYAHETMSANGILRGYAHEDKSGGYGHDYMTPNGESEGNAHENMATNDVSGGEDVKITFNGAVISTIIPSLMNSATNTKTGSVLSASSYYNYQSNFMKKLELMLRIGGAMFSLIAFSVMVSTNEKQIAAGSTFYVKFSDFQSYNYLVALNLLSFLYSSGQLFIFGQSRSSSILSSPIKWGVLVYICDQMLAFLLVSASSSAATASQLSRHGLHNIWPPACSTWKLWLFCSKADVAVVVSFFSSLLVMLSSFSSGYQLSNLLAE